MISDLKPATNKMLTSFNKTIWKQFGATIDMFENAIKMCPAEFWGKKQFWYKAFHTAFYLDYYLSVDPDKFTPPPPFTTSEFDPTEKIPERTYSKEEIISYLHASKKKLHNLMKNMTEETVLKRWVNPHRDYSFFEMLIYNMRHVQHHTAQLNLLLRQGINNAPKWVSQTEGSLLA